MNDNPRLILVTGLPGSGKTYFSKHLKKALNAVHLNTDIVREKMNAQGQYDAETKKKVYDRMCDEMVSQLNGRSDVIVDGTFYKKSIRRQFLGKASGLDSRVYIIKVNADHATIMERLQKDRPYSEAGTEAYFELKQNFDPIEKRHLVLFSDYSSIETMVEQAIKFINDRKTSA